LVLTFETNRPRYGTNVRTGKLIERALPIRDPELSDGLD
jgi:hypothetical protein